MIFLALLLTSFVNAQILKSFTTSSLLESSLRADEVVWLNPAGPLSASIGVTGAAGPLGSLGPFGDNFWNASTALGMVGSWEEFAQVMSVYNGPLSEYGPVFLTTELGEAMMRFSSLGTQHLAPGGVLHALGNSGPLGPLGVAGFLGPNGAHGYRRDKMGNYVSEQNKVVKSLKLETHEGRRVFDLYEFYQLNGLNLAQVLDTSFAIRGELKSDDEMVVQIKSTKKQWVNLLLVNEFSLDTFALSVTDHHKKISSNSRVLTNFINVFVESGTLLELRVKLNTSFHFLPTKPFRLFVTGSEKARSLSDRSFHK
jgi:hypothetical protein